MIPIPIPSKIVCVGRNYRAHAEELGNVVPEEPLIFFKPPSSLIGAGAPIRIPPGVGRVDYEGEIGVLIGRRATRVAEEQALSFVSHVLPLNDVTARDLQRKDSQWTRAKGFDTFCPVGRAVPATSVDLGVLSLVTRVNGVDRQRGSVSEMAFPIARIISFVSCIMTLEPGDLIATGTPEGVGPLVPGDRVEVWIPGVGSVENPVEPDRGGASDEA
jgi:2-keto-4-pentenoate hydratase/2-oxohepta-3-ene-1,7-dioic acid hydratase in catechol pathway